MKAPSPTTVVGLLFAVVIVVYLAGLPGRRAGARFPPAAADGRPRLAFSRAACPHCGADVWVSPGFEDPCPGCGAMVAGCARCGTPLTADTPRFPAAGGRGWLCPEHRAEEEWEDRKLTELDDPAAKKLPPDTPRARAVRKYIEDRLRAARRQGKEQYETFTDREALDFWKAPNRPADVPAAVKESAELYRRRDPNRNWSRLGVFRLTVGGEAAYLVWCANSGGGDGWLEAFDGDGTPLGYARHQDAAVFWRSKADARRKLFVGGLEPELLEVRQRRQP